MLIPRWPHNAIPTQHNQENGLPAPQHHPTKMAANGVAAAPPPLTPAAARSLLDSTSAFLFDCDGVIWKGDKLIDGVPDALRALRSMGKKLVFVTNNSTKSRKRYAEKFQGLGLDVNEDEIFTSSFAAAMFLKEKDFARDKKVYVVGEEGIIEELELAGFTCLGGPEDGKKTIQLKSNYRFEHDKNVGAVVVGLDQYINYYKLQACTIYQDIIKVNDHQFPYIWLKDLVHCSQEGARSVRQTKGHDQIMYATLCIRENPECLFIATNRDAVGHLTDLQEWPGAGCMVAAVCGSTQREPTVVGKPSTFMMDYLLQRYQIDTSKMCMVGDRLDTDILFGQSAGCKTLLVLSGVTTLSALHDPANSIHPDYFTSTVSDIIDLSRT